MKKIYFIKIVFVLSLLPSFIFGQTEKNTANQVQVMNKFTKDIPALTFSAPDVETLLAEDALRDKNGQYYRVGTAIEVNITPQNSGTWTMDGNGNKIWRLRVKYPGAKNMSFIFSDFHLYGQSTIDVYGADSKRVHKTYTADNVLEHGQQNMSLCVGDDLLIELVEPNGVQSSVIQIEKLFYGYRKSGLEPSLEKINESDPCQVNVNCSEGANWQDEKNGVARILMVQGFYQGLCTGSLVNNTEQDCTPYFLTAQHCAEDVTQNDLNNWNFYFNYEASGCTNPTSESQVPNQYLTGCQEIAGSNDVNGNTIAKSDFYLVRIGTQNNQTATIQSLKDFGAYWSGWDANNTASSNGVGIHHPSGDIKKISTYTSALVSSSYSNINPNTHWTVYWSATSNGHGVTEGGSSGSPIFNYNNGDSRIVGTLSGGSSYCNQVNSPDLYGKMSYHWESAGSTPNTQLKPWLDPENTGLLALSGSFDPCEDGGGTVDPPDPTGDTPCISTSGQCDEYIREVSLNSLYSNTGCDNYSLITNTTTTLEKGASYDLYVVPGIIGEPDPTIYQGDVVSAWIDFNKDSVFSANERVFYQLGTDYTTMESFEIPQSATTGVVFMRVKIGYQEENPCGEVQYGETEDYKVTIVNEGGGNEAQAPEANFIADQTNVPENTVVSFTNTSTNSPTSNLWSITPTSGWNYVNGSSSSSQHPKVNFTSQGAYSVSLTATNTGGSDTETKTNYIIVTNTSSINVNLMDNLFVYPNPTSSKLNFKANTGVNDTYDIKVMDLTGKLIIDEQTSGINEFSIDVSQLAQGMYQVLVLQGENKGVFKFVKE